MPAELIGAAPGGIGVTETEREGGENARTPAVQDILDKIVKLETEIKAGAREHCVSMAWSTVAPRGMYLIV